MNFLKRVLATIIGTTIGLVSGLFLRFVACALFIGAISVAVKAYRWIANEYFPSREVLVIGSCSQTDCEWRSEGREFFGDEQRVWEDVARHEFFAVCNRTGHPLLMTPVQYGSADQSPSLPKSFIIPPGWSTQTTRPDYLMHSSPSTIRTSASLNAIVTKWELSCQSN